MIDEKINEIREIQYSVGVELDRALLSFKYPDEEGYLEFDEKITEIKCRVADQVELSLANINGKTYRSNEKGILRIEAIIVSVPNGNSVPEIRASVHVTIHYMFVSNGSVGRAGFHEVNFEGIINTLSKLTETEAEYFDDQKARTLDKLSMSLDEASAKYPRISR